MPLTFLTFCKICRQNNPKHGGFAGPPLDSLNKEEQARFTAKLMEHVRQQHPEILGQNVAQSSMLLHFLNLCLYDFSDQSAVKARDNLRYELAKLTRAFRLSDAKIEDKVRDLYNAQYDYLEIEAVIRLIKSLRDQLEEIGAWSQEEPPVPKGSLQTK